MSVTGVSGTTGATDAEPAAKPDALGRDTFLQLLITQMQHQDPLQPQENGEFLAQLAQFSSLESLQQIKEDIAALRAAADLAQTAPTSTTADPVASGS
ncbi:MAG: hypothetical protein ABS36_12105 [Acidobacteria bacterium SCN 69-37]|mgnify:CR=1 FL=1|nr:MAG: hypothetical protein ABS36_12105 [Acidobacteria bacterium SCN 69-37]